MSGPAPHLLHVFSTFVPAGPEVRTTRIIAGLGQEFRHSILAMDGRTSAAKELPADAPARIMDNLPPAGTLQTTLNLRRLLQRERPDLVLTYNWGAFDAILAARSLGWKRLIHHEEGFNLDEAVTFKRRRVLARRWVLPGIQRLIVPSERLERLALGLWTLPAGMVLRIPNGIPTETFAMHDGNPELRDELGIPRDAPVLGTVGHLRPVKNYLRLLDAAAHLSPDLGAHVLVLGEGDQRPALEARAAQADLAGRVHLVGHRSDLHPYYRAMDVYVVSSDSEQMPITLLEAMASGLPAAATDVGDVRGILPDAQARHVVPLEDADPALRLSETIAELLGDPEMRRDLGEANRARVQETFPFRATLEAYRNAYRDALTA